MPVHLTSAMASVDVGLLYRKHVNFSFVCHDHGGLWCENKQSPYHNRRKAYRTQTQSESADEL